MQLRRSSELGQRFLTSVREDQGLKPAARGAGIGKEMGYRWLREAFVELRQAGIGVIQLNSKSATHHRSCSSGNRPDSLLGRTRGTTWPVT